MPSPENLHCIFFGINIGLTVIGILFYIIRLTGPLKSIRSLTYLFTVASLGGLSVCIYYLYIKEKSANDYVIHIIAMIASQGGVGYFVILVMNTIMVLDRKWTFIILAIPLPATILVEIWNFTIIFESINIKTGIDSELIGIASASNTFITDFIVNVVCYYNFLKYKEIEAIKPLLNQYASGSIFSILLDIAFILVSRFFKFDTLTIAHIAIIGILINLNIEYFLLYQIRLVLISQIQTHNS